MKSKEAYPVKATNGTTIQYPICRDWIDETEFFSAGTFFSRTTSTLVVLTSLILRKIFISLVQLTGFAKNT